MISPAVVILICTFGVLSLLMVFLYNNHRSRKDQDKRVADLEKRVFDLEHPPRKP